MNKAAFGMENCVDLYEKLKYEYSFMNRLHMEPYIVFNFLTTAKHIIDWIINDKNIDKNVRDEIAGVRKLEKNNRDFYIINSLCNHSKHFVLDEKNKNKEIQKREKHYNIDFSDIDFNDFFSEKCKYFVEDNNELVEVYEICTRYLDYITDFMMRNNNEFKRLNYL